MDICVTPEKPDLVIIDQKTKSLHIFELTSPFETNVETRHTEKSDKYAHFVNDCAPMKTSVTCFEVGSRGFVSTRNHNSLAALHKYVKPGLKLTKFKQNISALAVYTSYHIFIGRKEPVWSAPNYLLPPFPE